MREGGSMFQPEPDYDADDLERRIDHQALLLHTAKTRHERLAAWIELTRLHSHRSPARIRQMEEEAGLA
jgi:hypothetical protein